MLLSSGWGWKEAPFSPSKPCYAVCPRGFHGTHGDESKAVGSYHRRLCCLCTTAMKTPLKSD